MSFVLWPIYLTQQTFENFELLNFFFFFFFSSYGLKQKHC